MIREITAMNVRKNFGEILNEVKYRHDSVLIKKAGKPMAAIIDINLFEKIKTLKDKFDKLSMHLATAYKDTALEVAEAEIEEALESTKKA
ncbi:MAG: prevent-host-death protein [Alphaproteobacteria bacterium 16-39-46]|nr:MAG: prevent-host-death protein [Alphaproteobacteria bacterium 16-39-46]OZA43547.1 MAG: prevent-host-death protein [Alphaproteobacteria bacterium 17-39-52]HQS83804.1 type II toxin-antitoxin system Phd/YefM family antitoxin [Alphaproteobacteria bacterium]HQS93587.1 type II toxin-antitoxin system Phd/YefM family antitoxin [Alphaproteobacteria bacterium]